MSEFERLPAEIFNEIYHHLDRSDRTYCRISKLTKVCRTFYTHFVPKLYHVLRLGEFEDQGITGLRLAKLARTLVRNSSVLAARTSNLNAKNLALYVKNITIGAITHDYPYQGRNPCLFTHAEHEWFIDKIIPLQLQAKRPSQYPFHFARSHFKLLADTKGFFVAAILKQCTDVRSLVCNWDFLVEGNGIIDGFFTQTQIPHLETLELNYSSASILDIALFNHCNIKTLKVKEFVHHAYDDLDDCFLTKAAGLQRDIREFPNLGSLTSLTIVAPLGEPEGVLALVAATPYLKSLHWEEPVASLDVVAGLMRYHAAYSKNLDIYRKVLAAVSNKIEHLHLLVGPKTTGFGRSVFLPGGVHKPQRYAKLKTLEVFSTDFLDFCDSKTYPFAEVFPDGLEALKLRVNYGCPGSLGKQMAAIHSYIQSLKPSGDKYIKKICLDVPESFERITDKIGPVCALKSIQLKVLLRQEIEMTQEDMEDDAWDAYLRARRRNNRLSKDPSLRPQLRRLHR